MTEPYDSHSVRAGQSSSTAGLSSLSCSTVDSNNVFVIFSPLETVQFKIYYDDLKVYIVGFCIILNNVELLYDGTLTFKHGLKQMSCLARYNNIVCQQKYKFSFLKQKAGPGPEIHYFYYMSSAAYKILILSFFDFKLGNFQTMMALNLSSLYNCQF